MQMASAASLSSARPTSPTNNRYDGLARYFFDLVKEKVTAHDYQGRTFQLPEQAKHQGELIALDLQYASDGWGGGHVCVRDVNGKSLYMIPVGQDE